MGVFRKLAGLFLGESSALEEYHVNEITTPDEIQAMLAESRERPVFLFKHSTACPVSAGSYREVASYLEAAGDDAAPIYLIKVIESRPASNAAAEELGVTHQSPQLILVKDGAAVRDTSHGAITPQAMKGALEDHAA